MRLIDADAIPYVDLNSDMPQSKVRVWVSFKEKIDRLPTIEAEPKHGRWIKRGDNSWECSVCHEISCCNGNYCVDCGAKMDERREDGRC